MSIDAAADRAWRAALDQVAGTGRLARPGDSFGLEREGLRVLPDGDLALSPHPAELGCSMTNRYITTDFSESQLEFATSPYRSFVGLERELRDLQIFSQEVLNGAGRETEGLWPLSMPARLPAVEAEIPIAAYGNSPEGQAKHIYRQGLARRYGRRMQTVSGVHFNFSFAPALFDDVAIASTNSGAAQLAPQELRNLMYFAILRNFQRDAIFLMYLFGASPAIDRSFLARPDDRLHSFEFDPDTLYAPHATSLRLSDIGYTNSNQCELAISYDTLPDYIDSMCRAVSTPNPAYAHWNFERGEQLNSNYLQIENEHYSVIRPKQPPQAGERPLSALDSRGVRYLEVRCLDVDPYAPGGVNAERMAFVHLTLLAQLLAPAPALTRADCGLQRDNQKLVGWRGRDPELQLRRSADGPLENFHAAGRAWVEAMAPLARRLDREVSAARRGIYERSLNEQIACFEDPECTPSARVLSDMNEHRLGHIAFGTTLLARHRATLDEVSPAPSMRRKFDAANQASKRAFDRLNQDTNGAAAKQAPGLPPVCTGSSAAT